MLFSMPPLCVRKKEGQEEEVILREPAVLIHISFAILHFTRQVVMQAGRRYAREEILGEAVNFLCSIMIMCRIRLLKENLSQF